jgi:hypothetical protein
LVSVYDGDTVGLGRVVVDSTWHHWFSMNLVGIAHDDVPAYEKMQAYFRNVAMWLTRPHQRRTILVSGIWGVLTSSAPMTFARGDSPWQIGERVLAVLGKTACRCMLTELVAPLLSEKMRAVSTPREPAQSTPSWASLPDEFVGRAIVGSIGAALLDLALDHRERRDRGQRPRLDTEAIRKRAIDGVHRGRALLRQSIDDAANAIAAIRADLSEADTRPVELALRIELCRLRIVLETLQVPDPTDPALFGQVTVTIRIKLDDDVVAQHVLERFELPAFEARGAIVALGHEMGEIDVHLGESLTIELLVSPSARKHVCGNLPRFKHTLTGIPSGWLGHHEPALPQPWRLWYTIEAAGKQ